MLKIVSQKLNVQPKPEDYPDLVNLEDMEKDFHPHSEVGIPSPVKNPEDMSATMTLNPGPDQKLTVEELQQQVAQLDATLTAIKQQLQQLSQSK